MSIEAMRKALSSPVAWRVKNDFGHWYVTQDKALADTYRDVEKKDVQPLYLAAQPPDAPVETAMGDVLATLVLEYARDLRRNSSGGDDYPWEYAKGTADHLEELVRRCNGATAPVEMTTAQAAPAGTVNEAVVIAQIESVGAKGAMREAVANRASMFPDVPQGVQAPVTPKRRTKGLYIRRLVSTRRPPSR